MEVVGGVAASLQLADAGFRSLIQIYGVVRDATEVPRKLQDIFYDVENFRILLCELQAETSRLGSKLALAPVQSQRLASTLQATASCTNALSRSLEKVLPTSADSKFKRAWRALATLPREEGILKECDRLQKLKQDIQMELHMIGIKLIDLTK